MAMDAKTECDFCGWQPESGKMRAVLADKKRQYREIRLANAE